MNRAAWLMAIVCAASTVWAVAQTPGQAGAKITGTAAYRERIALLPGALFEATLEDVARPDTKATVLGTARVENVGVIPIKFEIPYDPKAIDPSHAYAVRGRIVVNGKLAYTTDTVYPVLTRGAGAAVDLLLVSARSGPPAAAPPEGAPQAAPQAAPAAVPERDLPDTPRP